MAGARGIVAILGALATLATASPVHAAFGDVRTLAPFPAQPGFPEGVAVRDASVFAAGPATLGTAGTGPSAVMRYDRASGATLARYDAVGEQRLMEHADSSIAFDGDGRLYVLNTQLGIYRLTPGGQQQPYASPFPDLLPCVPLLIPPPCSPTPHNLPPIPNDIAFAPNGDAFVSDSMQATIWRIAAGGGAPQIWFQDRRFASPYIGTNGLRLSPDGTRIFISVTVDLLGRASIYSLPRVAHPGPADLALFHRFGVGELPDGIAFGAHGDLSVAMASVQSSGIAILRPDGSAGPRLGNPGLQLFTPYDGPANLAFDGAGRVLVTNHAPFSGLVLRRFSVLDVDVQDTGAPLFAPDLP
jgi:sugar lactone lactonase YvrE